MYPIFNLCAGHGAAALPARKKGGTQCTGGWGEGGDLSGRLRKISIPPRFKSRTAQPVSSRCISYLPITQRVKMRSSN